MPAKMEAPADAVKQIETFAAETQKSVSEQLEKATKSIETVATFGQENLDAMMKAQNIAAKAAEGLQAEVIAFSKKSIEESVAHAKELATVQTVADFVEKQAGFAKHAFDGFVRQSTKLNEMTVAAMKDAMAPLTARATAAVETVKGHAA